MSNPIFSVNTKSGSYKVGQKVQTGFPGCVKTWKVPEILQEDNGWVTVRLERVEEERRPKMAWSEINSAMCIPDHWVVNVTDLMKEDPNV